jgi:hypothetical protein
MRLSQEENSENVAAKREFYVQKSHDHTSNPVTIVPWPEAAPRETLFL